MINGYRLVPALAALLVVTLLPVSTCAGTPSYRRQVPPGTRGPSLLPEKPQDTPRPRGSVLATLPEVEPNDDGPTAQAIHCGDVVDPARIASGDDQDVYRFTAQVGQKLTLGTDQGGVAPFVGDTFLFLADSLGNFLTYDDESGPGSYSLISNFVAPYSGTYYAIVFGFLASDIGGYQLFLQCYTPAPPPVNDDCAGSIEIRCGAFDVDGNSESAAGDYTPVSNGTSCTGYPANGNDVVYTFSIQPGQALTLAYTSSAADGAVYLITDCAAPGATCVAGADTGIFGETETLSYTHIGSDKGIYYLICDNYGTGTGGPFKLTGTLTCPPVPVAPTSWGSLKARFGR